MTIDGTYLSTPSGRTSSIARQTRRIVYNYTFQATKRAAHLPDEKSSEIDFKNGKAGFATTINFGGGSEKLGRETRN